jgi:hypothetical protein
VSKIVRCKEKHVICAQRGKEKPDEIGDCYDYLADIQGNECADIAPKIGNENLLDPVEDPLEFECIFEFHLFSKNRKCKGDKKGKDEEGKIGKFDNNTSEKGRYAAKGCKKETGREKEKRDCLVKNKNKEELNPIYPDSHFVFPCRETDTPDHEDARRFCEVSEGKEIDHRDIHNEAAVNPPRNIAGIKGKPDESYHIHCYFPFEIKSSSGSCA